MKVSNSFHIQEFVPKEIYDKFGEKSIWFVRQDLIELAQFIRDYFGRPMTINNWHKGGKFNERGYRTPDSTTGSKYSQHKLSGAIDFNIEGMTSNEVRSLILADSKRFLSHNLTTLEHEDYAPTWVHADMRTTNLNSILIVKPSISTQSLEESEDEYFVFNKSEMISVNFPLKNRKNQKI